MWNFLEAAKRIAGTNRWIAGAIAVLVGLYAFEFVADRGIDLWVKLQNAPQQVTQMREETKTKIATACASAGQALPLPEGGETPEQYQKEITKVQAADRALNPECYVFDRQKLQSEMTNPTHGLLYYLRNSIWALLIYCFSLLLAVSVWRSGSPLRWWAALQVIAWIGSVVADAEGVGSSGKDAMYAIILAGPIGSLLILAWVRRNPRPPLVVKLDKVARS